MAHLRSDFISDTHSDNIVNLLLLHQSLKAMQMSHKCTSMRTNRKQTYAFSFGSLKIKSGNDAISLLLQFSLKIAQISAGHT